LGKVKEPELAMLFIGMLYSDPVILHHVQQTLKGEFGEPLLESPASKWDYSPYYRNELGWPLSRKFIFFKNIIDPETLAAIKVRTNEIEDSFSVKDKRQINLDPGYLTLSKIVVASTKNYAHRIYLQKGIYGEITLYYQDGIFKPHLFTYRDFQEKSCLDMFMQARGLFKTHLDEKAT
jgi:Domain of unknown function (DUF4416)